MGATTPSTPVGTDGAPTGAPVRSGRARSWPVLLLAAPAFVAIWSGWVGLGGLTGFGVIHPLPGTPASGWTLNTAITLPIGVETYAAYALRVWLDGAGSRRAVAFARISAIASLVLGAAGQVAYHLMAAANIDKAPWQITTLVACIPVAVLGMGAALAHLVHSADAEPGAAPTGVAAGPPAERQVAGAVEPDPATDTPVSVDARTVEPAARAGTSGATAGRRSGVTTNRRGATAVAVAQLSKRHPDLAPADIANRLGVTERTVRRHLSAAATTLGTASTVTASGSTTKQADPTTTTEAAGMTDPADDLPGRDASRAA